MSTDSSGGPPDLPGLNYVRPLGRGGYAEVFLYEQTSPRMRVAVKVLFGEGLSAIARERFAAEANTMAELADHPNIVQVFRSDVTEDGRPYLVMKYYPQHNLAVRASNERLSVPEVLQIGVRIGCAVETAHRAGILHRDIKPANILTSQYGEPGLTDFGIATTGADVDAESEGVSIPWAPPEVLFGSSPGDRSSDVYSLGATLWHLLVGRSPFEDPGGDNTSIAMMRRIREMPPPSTRRDDVPASLERLLAQTMTKDPIARPQSAFQLARALQSIESEQRWAPTPLVLIEAAEDAAETVEHDDGADGGATSHTSSETRVRRPDIVAGSATRRRPATVRPASAPQSPPAGALQVPESDLGRDPGTRGARVRQGMPEVPDDPQTVRRPKAVLPTSAEVTGTEPNVPAPGKSRRAWLMVGAAVALCGSIGVVVALAGGGHNNAASTTTTISGPATAPTIVSESPPAGPSQPVGTRVSPSQVQFTWTIPNEAANDVVGWASTNDPSHVTTVEHNKATVDATGAVCIVVYVKNSSGQLASQSTPGCGG